MYVYITPNASGFENGRSEAPINLIAENRTDIILLMLRIIRYLFQNDVCGDKLIWSNEPEESGISIEVLSPELLSDTNMRPAIFLDVGEVTYRHGDVMDDKASMDMKGGSTKYSRHNLSVDLTVIGRNKLESSYIAERTAAALFLITDSIKENTQNLESIDNFRVGRTQQLNTDRLGPAGDTSLAFLTRVTFSTAYYLELGQFQVGDLFTSMNFKITSKKQEGNPAEEDMVIESSQVYTNFIR